MKACFCTKNYLLQVSQFCDWLQVCITTTFASSRLAYVNISPHEGSIIMHINYLSRLKLSWPII